MFVIVKQERFATVSVGILKLLFPHFITGSQSEGIKVFVYMKVICSGVIFKTIFFIIIIIVNVLFWSQEVLLWALCCLCCSAKAC